MKKLILILMCFAFLAVSYTSVKADIQKQAVEQVSLDQSAPVSIDLNVYDFGMVEAPPCHVLGALTNCVVASDLNQVKENISIRLHGRNVDYTQSACHLYTKTTAFDFSFNRFLEQS